MLARCVLSMCANAAFCERLFSTLGNILTKLRNRLGNSTLLSLAELKMLIRDENLRKDNIKKQLKRQLESDRRTTQQGLASADMHAPDSLVRISFLFHSFIL